jgi:hypothetical protein
VWTSRGALCSRALSAWMPPTLRGPSRPTSRPLFAPPDQWDDSETASEKHGTATGAGKSPVSLCPYP